LEVLARVMDKSAAIRIVVARLNAARWATSVPGWGIRSMLVRLFDSDVGRGSGLTPGTAADQLLQTLRSVTSEEARRQLREHVRGHLSSVLKLPPSEIESMTVMRALGVT